MIVRTIYELKYEVLVPCDFFLGGWETFSRAGYFFRPMLFIYKEFGSLFSLTSRRIKNVFCGPFPWDCAYHPCARVWGFFFSCKEAVLHARVLHMPLFGQRQITALCNCHYFFNYRITEWFGLEGIFRGHLFQPPCCEQGNQCL